VKLLLVLAMWAGFLRGLLDWLKEERTWLM